MTIRYEFIKRDIAGEDFLVPVGDAAKKFPGMFALNELASFIWDKLPEAENAETIVAAILNEYDTDESTATADTAEFLGKLREMGIVD